MNLRTISQASLDRLAQLNKPSKPWQLSPWNNQHTEVIAGLSDCGEPAVALYLLRHTLSGSVKMRTAARQAVSKLLSLFPSEGLMELDVWVREFTGRHGQYVRDEWSSLSRSATMELTSSVDGGLLAFASMHPNGYVREAAVAVLAEQKTGEELGFLLVRANDWVGPVREKAQAAISARIGPDYARPILKYLPLILQLEKCQRAEHGWLAKGVGDLLLRPECGEVLQTGLVSENRDVRLACLQFLQESNGNAQSQAFLAATHDRDSMVRFYAARTLLALANSETAAKLCDTLKKDNFMPVRREALLAVIRHQLPNLVPILKASLLDRHASIRELARFHLKGIAETAQIYREALHTVSGLKFIAAIRGLGECGSPADSALLAAYLSFPSPSARAASILSLGLLSPKPFADQFLDALADPSPSVSAAACAALRSFMPVTAKERLSALLSPPFAACTRKNAFRLVSRFGKWDQIAAFLSVCRDPLESLSASAVTAVRNWLARYNRSFTAPSASQIANALQEIRQSQEFLDRRTLLELEILFKEWTR